MIRRRDLRPWKVGEFWNEASGARWVCIAVDRLGPMFQLIQPGALFVLPKRETTHG